MGSEVRGLKKFEERCSAVWPRRCLLNPKRLFQLKLVGAVHSRRRRPLGAWHLPGLSVFHAAASSASHPFNECREKGSRWNSLWDGGRAGTAVVGGSWCHAAAAPTLPPGPSPVVLLGGRPGPTNKPEGPSRPGGRHLPWSFLSFSSSRAILIPCLLLCSQIKGFFLSHLSL